MAHCLWIAIVWLTAGSPVFAAAAAVPGEAECKALAQTLVTLLRDRQADEFFKYFDRDMLLERAFEGVPDAGKMKPEDRNELKDGFVKGFSQSIARGGEYEYLRYQADPEPRVLIRINRDSGDFDYLILTLAPVRRQLRIVDLSTFSTGENASMIMRKSVLPLLAEQNKSLLQKLTGEQSDYVGHQSEILAFHRLNRERKYGESLAAFRKLPPSIQSGKAFQIVYMNIVRVAAPAEFPAAVAQFRKLFPGDPSIAYYSYKAHLASKEYAELLGDIDQMDTDLGPDRFFYELRARAHILMNNPAAALKTAKDGLATPRNLDQLGIFYLQLLQMTRRFEEATTFLSELERDTGKEMYAVIRKNMSSPEFERSQEFKAWMGSPTKIAVNPAIKPATTTAGAPLRLSPAAAKAPEPVKEPEPDYKLGGILYSKNSPAAIINGKTLYVGDKIKEAKVLKIEQSSVTIEVDGKTQELRLK